VPRQARCSRVELDGGLGHVADNKFDLSCGLGAGLLISNLFFLAFESLQLLRHVGESSSEGRATVLRGALGCLCAVQLGIIAGQRCLLGRVRVARYGLFGLRELRRETFALILAAEIPSIHNGGLSPDGKSVTWKLKPGVKWHHGEPFTADDVVFNWEFAKDPATAAVTIAVFETLPSRRLTISPYALCSTNRLRSGPMLLLALMAALFQNICSRAT
jgi:hypothetical protein